MKMIIRTCLIAISLLVAGTGIDGVFNHQIIIKDAQARMGRPMTPVSAAGVARRTTRRVVRRTIRRTAVYVAVLPTGCTTVVIEGTALQQCGSTYYQVSGTQYVIVTVE
jgi:hypothetical protein